MASAGVGKMIFMTGATGHIGSVVADLAIKDGYTVRGLSRSETGDEKLTQLGAHPVRGSLQDLSVLRDEAARADIIIHLAFNSFIDKPNGFEEALRIDMAAVNVLAEPLQGTSKPLIISSGALVVKPQNGEETNEDSPIDPSPFVPRIRSEQHALSWTDKGVNVISIRLAPYVYGHGRSGIFMFLAGALRSGQSVYIGDGHWPTSSVHVDDAARLYLLAAQKGQKGDIYNATSQIDTTARHLAEAMVDQEQAEKAMPVFVTKFLTAECRASSAKAQKELG